MDRLVMIDGNAILHRAYHAMPPLTTSKGELVNAVFGFTSILLKIFHDFKPGCAVVCFDRKAPTFRKEKFKDYQAKRPKMEDNLSEQIERVHEVVRALNIPIFELDGYEADDIIGSLVLQATQMTDDGKQKTVTGKTEKTESVSSVRRLADSEISLQSSVIRPLEIIIVTGDRDLLQLVNKNTKVYLPIRGLSIGILLDEKGVEEKMGVRPGLIPDLKGLIGDQSDNYPGVPGIGPKTAIGLLGEFGGFEEIYKNLDKIGGETAEKLRKGREMGKISYELATIRRDAPVKLKLENCNLLDYNYQLAVELLDELEFRSLIPRLPRAGQEEKQEVEKEESKEQLGLF